MQRYRHLPKNMEQTMEMMRSGMAKNITAHLASMEVRKQTFKNKTLQMTKYQCLLDLYGPDVGDERSF